MLTRMTAVHVHSSSHTVHTSSRADLSLSLCIYKYMNYYYCLFIIYYVYKNRHQTASEHTVTHTLLLKACYMHRLGHACMHVMFILNIPFACMKYIYGYTCTLRHLNMQVAESYTLIHIQVWNTCNIAINSHAVVKLSTDTYSQILMILQLNLLYASASLLPLPHTCAPHAPCNTGLLLLVPLSLSWLASDPAESLCALACVE